MTILAESDSLRPSCDPEFRTYAETVGLKNSFAFVLASATLVAEIERQEARNWQSYMLMEADPTKSCFTP